MLRCLFPFQLKWKCKKDSETNGGYSQDVLLKLLQKVNVLTNKISGGLCYNHTLHCDTFWCNRNLTWVIVIWR